MSDHHVTVIDTDVFSVVYLRRRSIDDRKDRWRELLTGRRVVIAFQTRAEILAGARTNGWEKPRMDHVQQLLADTPTIRTDNDVIAAYARLSSACRSSGHALHQKEHTADRWIAACAISKAIDLLSGDGVYRDAPGLHLLGDSAPE